MNIAGVEIGPDQPCRVVAELSNNHNGQLANALRLIEECADAGADFVKLQCYTPAELVKLRGNGPAPEPWGAAGWTMRKLYKKAQTPHEWFPDLVAKCEEVGVPWFSSVFGWESLKLLDSLGCPAYKIAALDVDSDFAATLLEERKSAPMIEAIASSMGQRVPGADLTLFCPPGYPQDWSTATSADCDGISYHGTRIHDLFSAIAAFSPWMIEVHVQLDDVPSELESNVSLTVSQLRRLCQSIRG